MKQEEKELTNITKELLERTNNIKESTKKAMVVGEYNIIKGIIVFEAILKEVNPTVINDEEILKIANLISIYLSHKEDEEQRVNRYMHYGVDKCLLMLNIYNSTSKRKKHSIL